MNQPQPPRWMVEKPSFAQMLKRAVGRSFFTGAIVSIVYFAGMFLYALFQPDMQFGYLFGKAGQALALVWALSFPLFLIAASRIFLDRAFTVAGFLATFIGLAVLAVFFFRLAGEVRNWFHYTPLLVQAQNEENQKTIDAFTSLKEANDEKIAQLEQERDELLRQAKNEDERKEIRALFEFGIREQREDKTAETIIEIARRSMRPDTSPWGMLAYFLDSGPAKDPQDSGIGPALWGSVWLGVITILFAIPVGVGAALYLEEYRQEGWLAKIIQVNINNLAGVPSVVYGILGGFVFVYLFRQVSRHQPEVDPFNLFGGGLTLGLLALPLIIVSAQEAIRAVPSSLRQGAYALGATKWQVIWTIVLPMARPGILTGAILSLSRAIGEAAPLVLFGAQQYVDRSPSLFKPFTALPLQIFQWSGEPSVFIGDDATPVEIWQYNAAVASTILLLVLLSMNAVAIIVRQRAQRKSSY